MYLRTFAVAPLPLGTGAGRCSTCGGARTGVILEEQPRPFRGCDEGSHNEVDGLPLLEAEEHPQ